MLTLIVTVGIVFRKAPIPTSLLLVITGMLVSFVPSFPPITLNPNMVLDVFLPLLIYETSAYSSWRDIKLDFRPIALLSVGHVIFITVLVALKVHLMLPQLGRPMAFILGAVISPPDDVAIVSIAEKIRMPQRIVSILTPFLAYLPPEKLGGSGVLATVVVGIYRDLLVFLVFSTIIATLLLQGMALPWQEGKINQNVKLKLGHQLDIRSKHLKEMF